MTDIVNTPIKRHELLWLIAGITLCVLPHGWHLPAWIMLLSITLIVWRLAITLKKWPLPKHYSSVLQMLQTVAVAAGFIGIFFYYHTLVGRDAGTALLVLLTGFKVLETYTGRDFYITVFLGFFVIITNFFYSQSIPTAVLMLFTVFVLITALVTFNDRQHELQPLFRIRTTAMLVLHALPIMLIIFLLFPRIEGPLWGMPKDTHAGLIGLSDEMEPGSISSLVESDEVAFRVEFLSEPPKHSLLYWRGPVFWHTDGRKWSSQDVTDKHPATVTGAGKPVRYAITLEPHNKRWLFALEMPEAISNNGYITYDYQFRTRKPVRSRIRYELTSYPQYLLGQSNRYEIQRALQLPPYAHKKTIALASKWREETDNPQEIINRALTLFNSEDFYYTMTPPVLQGDNVDEFLFRTRQGFCEHYASAFVILMRGAGIPARIVTGYQGGSFNPVGEYFNVYQRDAHAWAEVWLDGSGWVRVDPTSAVSPARVEQGIENALPESVNEIPAMFGQSNLSRTLWLRLQNTWDAINHQWNQWVISYGPERQLQFLQNIGLGKIKIWALTLLLAAAVIALLMLISLWLMRQPKSHTDPARQAYDRFCRKLAAIGMQRRANEGPVTFAERVVRRYHKLAGAVNTITELYIKSRYGGETRELGQLQLRVRQFKPARLLRHAVN